MEIKRKPPWLTIRIKGGKKRGDVEKILSDYNLHTVCEEAACPNRCECFASGTATFLIMGPHCSRSCRFCNVSSEKPLPLDPQEPRHLAEAVSRLGLKHVVITSVTRDDLADGGSAHFVECVRLLKKNPETPKIELLIPDFQGDQEALFKVLDAGPDILNHNVETVPSLYSRVRPQADFEQSLQVLTRTKENYPSIFSKSGFMLGLGECREEVLALLQALYQSKCEILTIGQYLPPSKNHYPLQDYIHPDVFAEYKKIALDMGFKAVASGPFVRSSYFAADLFSEII